MYPRRFGAADLCRGAERSGWKPRSSRTNGRTARACRASSRYRARSRPPRATSSLGCRTGRVDGSHRQGPVWTTWPHPWGDRSARKDVTIGKGVPVGLGMGGERLGHKADLDQWPDIRGDQGIEDAVGDGEIVDWRAVRALGVDVGRAPFEGTVAVAGGEQIMGGSRPEPGSGWLARRAAFYRWGDRDSWARRPRSSSR